MLYIQQNNRGMFLKKDHIIRKQIEINKKSQKYRPLSDSTINQLQKKALQELSLQKINSRQIDYSRIQMFLTLATEDHKAKFYQKLKVDLNNIFKDDKTKKTFQDKWSLTLKSNIMKLFNKITSQTQHLSNFTKLYADTILRLFQDQRLSRIQQKFIDPFLVSLMRTSTTLDKALGAQLIRQIKICAANLSKIMQSKQTPKTLSNCQFLQYAVLSLLNMELPHEKYLSNQLIHAPNPKFLLPFRKKGTFGLLTNQILLKMNKIDMVGIKYWSYFSYQDCDIYEKIRKASGWQNKGDTLLQVIKRKVSDGLIKYLNLINEKAMLFNNRNINDEGINSLNSYVEMSLHICYNRVKGNQQGMNQFESALEKIDIGHCFQFKNLTNDYRLKHFMIKLVQLYLILLVQCSKKNLRIKFIRNVAKNICKLIENHSEEKFTSDMSILVTNGLRPMQQDQKSQFFLSIIDYLNREWESKQQHLLNSQITMIDPHTVAFLAHINNGFQLNDRVNQDLKVLKLQFFYIMALNFKNNIYFESKKLLSITSLDINVSLSNNSLFNILEMKKPSSELFKSHLRSLYGDYEVTKPEHQGLLAVIDQISTYRIQAIKDNPAISEKYSFYGLMVSILEQAGRLDNNSTMVDLILKYFQKCRKTYLIEIVQMKYKDQTKEQTKQLITKQVCYLIEGSVSANPIIAKFCQQTLFQHIEDIPQLAFYSNTLVVFAECISVLYRKQSQQYQSKAEKMKGKYLSDSILIPTNNKEVLKRMTKLMCALYHVILRGNCIDDVYIRIRCQHLIRENSKSVQITFGWKFLKHLIGSFKQDKDFILKQVLNNNSCSWFISEQYFSGRIKKLQPQKILLDSNLIPLHEGNCDTSQLKKIMATAQTQVQTQFLIVPIQTTQSQQEQIIRSLQSTCQKIQTLTIFQPFKEEIIRHSQNLLYDIISRVKMIHITKLQQLKITSQILQLSRKYNNHQLLEYTLLKIIPFFYCIEDFDSLTLSNIAQTLNFIVCQLNNVTRMVLHKPTSEDDTFDVSLNCFDLLEQYQKNQQSTDYYNLLKKNTGNEDKLHRFMIIKLYKYRINSLQKSYLSIMKFLSSHLHVGIAKSISLSVLMQIFSINFELKNETFQFLPLQSIGYCLTSHFELVNVLKSSIQKGQTQYNQAQVDDFYFRSLKLGLYHFQKRKTFHSFQLHSHSRNIKSMRYKIDFFIKICDYLRNQDFHKITKKKLPKRNQIFLNEEKKGNQLLHLLQTNYRPKKIQDRVLELNSLKESVIHRSKIQIYSNQIYLDLPVLRYTLLYLISQEIDKAKAYSPTQLGYIKNPYSLAGKKKFINNSQILKLYEYLGKKDSSVLIYCLIKTFGNRIQDPQEILQKLKQNISHDPDYGFPDFLDLFVQKNIKDLTKLKQVNYWKTQHIQLLFKYLSPQYQTFPYIQLYVTKVLSRLHSAQILFYLPQIYQALTLKTGKIIYTFLLDYARKSASFAHQLIWISKVQAKQQKDPHNKNPRLPGVDQNLAKLQKMSLKLIKSTIRQFNRQQKSFFRQVDDFYEQVTAISGKMLPSMPSAQKKDRIKSQVLKLKLTKSVYLPINPIFKVVSINTQSGTPMQSAAKCPFLLTFNCVQYEGPDEYFENMKIQKKKETKRQIDFQFEMIKTEQIPRRLPGLGVISIGKSMIREKRQSQKIQKSQKKSIIIDPNSINLQFNLQTKISRKKKETISSNQKIDSISNKKQLSIINNNQKIESISNKKQLSITNNNIILSPFTEISCIFKVFDDIRQDCLALQVIRLFKQIFERHNLDLKLFPYKTISNRTGSDMNIGGIIEVVPKTVSIDSIGKTNEEQLYQFFINNFGPQYNLNFQIARENFIRSQAAYSVISYILQIKDRHNGNILINKEEGYLVHIDFGFIFDISPANNLRFQRADFKLTEQMIKIMGGKIQSQPFELYLNLVIKGFLIVRKYHQHIVNIVNQMFRSGLPCFLLHSIQNLTNRFVLQLNQLEAAQYMKSIVINAADHWTTNWYDRIQYIQQKIHH